MEYLPWAYNNRFYKEDSTYSDCQQNSEAL